MRISVDEKVVNPFSRLRTDDDVRRFANRFGFLWVDERASFWRSAVERPALVERALWERYGITNDVQRILRYAQTMRDVLAIARKPGRTADDVASMAITVGNILLDVGNIYAGLQSDDKGHLTQYFAPRSLIGGIWIAFANAIADGPSSLATCEYCNSVYVMTAKPRGKPRRFCGTACKQQAARKLGKEHSHVDHI